MIIIVVIIVMIKISIIVVLFRAAVRSAQVTACDDIGIPYRRAYALSSYALTCVALKRVSHAACVA